MFSEGRQISVKGDVNDEEEKNVKSMLVTNLEVVGITDAVVFPNGGN